MIIKRMIKSGVWRKGKFVKDIDCVVIGDAMIDIILPLTHLHLEDLSDLLKGGTANTEVKVCPGGTANVAFYIAKLGGKSAFIGKIGEDYFGDMFIRDLIKNKIILNVSISKAKETGKVFDIILPNGERFFIVSRGANAELEYEDVAMNLIEKAKFLYFTGFSFQDKKTSTTVQKVVEETSENTRIVFNPGAPNLAKKFQKLFMKIIKKHVHVIVFNEAEGVALTGCTSSEDIVKALTALTEIVVLTRGAKGSIIAKQERTLVLKTEPLKAVDTTGAGDAYAGAFIYGLSRGWDEERAGKLAIKIASETIAQMTARIGFNFCRRF